MKATINDVIVLALTDTRFLKELRKNPSGALRKRRLLLPAAQMSNLERKLEKVYRVKGMKLLAFANALVGYAYRLERRMVLYRAGGPQNPPPPPPWP